MKLKIMLLILFAYSFNYAQQYGNWNEIDSLNTFRAGDGVAVLPNGNILVGGNDPFFGQDSCEIYDINTNRWRYTDSMNVISYIPKMITLNNGKVLVAGSYEDRSCELFDPITETWSMTDSIPSFHDLGTEIIKLKNGNIMVLGGYYYDKSTTPWELTYLNECDIYNPSTENWAVAAPMLIPRSSHTATLLNDGRVLITGGFNSDSLGLRECEIYDTITNSWETAAPMNDIRYSHDAILLPNGNVFVSGGPSVEGGGSHWLKSTEVYNVQNNTWSYAGDMIDHRSGNKMFYLSTINKILILGGAVLQPSFEDTWEIFDPVNLVSLYVKPFPITQFLIPSIEVQLTSGNIMLVGGAEYGESPSGMLWASPTKRCWLFDVITDVKTNDLIIENYKLLQNYPNPFNPSTNISFQIPHSSEVKLIVYNVLGEKIKTLVSKSEGKGNYTVSWNGKNNFGQSQPSGIYIIKLFATSTTGNYTSSIKSIMLK